MFTTALRSTTASWSSDCKSCCNVRAGNRFSFCQLQIDKPQKQLCARTYQGNTNHMSTLEMIPLDIQIFSLAIFSWAEYCIMQQERIKKQRTSIWAASTHFLPSTLSALLAVNQVLWVLLYGIPRRCYWSGFINGPFKGGSFKRLSMLQLSFCWFAFFTG